MKITEIQKKQIVTALKNYVVSFTSQKKASEKLGVSEATVISMIKGNWHSISDEMWINTRNLLGLNKRAPEVVETADFKSLCLYYTLAKKEGATFSVVGKAGSGKTLTGKWFAEQNRTNNVYYLECAQYWNKKQFLSKLLNAMGKDDYGMNVLVMMETIVKDLRRQHEPLIILDEIDKLNDAVLTFFITLYNELNTMCGFVWTSTNNIEKRILRGLQRNTTGYQELFSRIGSRFVELKGVSKDEIKDICIANGIESDEEIAKIINESGGDLRRIERNFLKDRAKQLRANPSTARHLNHV